MTVKDILTVTSGSTKVTLFTLDENNHGITLWAGTTGDINFNNAKKGRMTWENSASITVLNGTDVRLGVD